MLLLNLEEQYDCRGREKKPCMKMLCTLFKRSWISLVKIIQGIILVGKELSSMFLVILGGQKTNVCQLCT